MLVVKIGSWFVVLRSSFLVLRSSFLVLRSSFLVTSRSQAPVYLSFPGSSLGTLSSCGSSRFFTSRSQAPAWERLVLAAPAAS
ncbi:hypothetical protein [Desulfonatronospira sp.]|uniref:hypothetical protein n=1 Tax=Desulfonatronospira sp. TaxID=1962951 RepID=UPI0025BE9612|nr:hypothetical protein [Desulfonatronospira sp.]